MHSGLDSFEVASFCEKTTRMGQKDEDEKRSKKKDGPNFFHDTRNEAVSVPFLPSLKNVLPSQLAARFEKHQSNRESTRNLIN